ncbi:MAG TPA: hypothetical protein VM120_11150 [Bryobacteraceae bacterium]|nr:hypothetical protein [Bryobacteraceae bacterium]
MNCQEFAPIVRDFLLRKWDNAAEASFAQQHVAACAACQERLRQEGALQAALATLSREAAALQAPPHVQAAVLAAFRQVRPPRAPQKRHLWLSAAAAASLLAAILSFRAPRAAAPHSGAEARRSLPPLLEPPPSPADAAGSPTARTRPLKVRPTRARAENVTGFIPLRYGKPVEAGETFQILRIQLPRAELLRMGLPVAMDGASNSTVRADVLLGEDGLAKAIRFVY